MLESKHIDIVIDTTAEQQSSADTIDVRQKLPGPPCKKTCSQSEVLANETSDEMLARVLQEEEKCEIERQKEKEKEEFHKLQVLMKLILLNLSLFIYLDESTHKRETVGH